MFKILIRRLVILPFFLLLANFFGFAYALFARWVQASRNPFFAITEEQPPLLPSYLAYLRSIGVGFGQMPTARGVTILESVGQATLNSLGLLAVAFSVSVLAGVLIGFWATRNEPAGVRNWLAPITTIGLALPSFYIGAMLIAFSLYYLLWGSFGTDLPMPLYGFGWDKHLVFPTIALSVHPTVQIAQVMAILLSGELAKLYVTAGRSVGHRWSMIRRKFALRNVLSPITLNIAANFRWMLAELILVELLFGWSGIGRMLAMSLMPPAITSAGRTILGLGSYMNPALVATLVTVFALFFQLADIIASALNYHFDPRLQTHIEEVGGV